MHEPTLNCAGRWARWAAGALLVMGAGSVMGQVTVGAGSVMNVGSGKLQGGCADLQVAGQLLLGSGQATGWNNLAIGAAGQVNGGSGLISLSGDFSNGGSFTAGTSEVRSVDGCGATRSAFTGSTQFYRLLASTTMGRTLVLQAGFTQTVTGALTLSGAPGNLLQVRSSTPGTAANLNLVPGATQQIGYVDVADNHATGQVIGQGTLASFNSAMGPNTSRWFVPNAGGGVGTVTPVPTLGGWGMLGVLATLVLGAWRRPRPASALRRG